MNRLLQLILALAAASIALPAAAQPKPEDASYRAVNPPQPTEAGPGKVEVVEFFWYGCPHCYTLEPVLRDWASKLPPDVTLRKVHVPFREVRHQQLYYTLEVMGKADELNDKVFNAIHQERNPLNTPERMADFVSKHGIDRQKFLDTYGSFTVRTRMSRANQLADGYKIDGVPALGVNGKYLTAPSMAGSNLAALQVVDKLVARERKAN
ncbi:MAG TPA: thiol:disulfide interchange protein DsbA/DsbL [Burkholderiaceae bacterium]|jgi:protein dithiol oxidoreductase (disulfide-forming)|nr:thiol:disulfide interchange protein DsbA/DsbL [Burkholderiaceae bacterium]